jgi:hypothetical protein
MRAILIDPENQTLTEIQIGEDSSELYKAIGCRDFTTGAFLNGSLAAGFDSILVSDDCMDDDDDPRFWFQVDADRKPPSSHPIPGRGVALGAGTEGESCDVRISVDELRARITFTQRKFRGFETFTGAQAHARGADLVVEMKVPIIDGTMEECTTILPSNRPDSWNCKMLSGTPLITDQQFEQLLANGLGKSETTVPVVKIFLPHIRWFLIGLDVDLDTVFAVIKRGTKQPEADMVSLSDVVASRLGSMTPERDLYIHLDKPWPFYLQPAAAE